MLSNSDLQPFSSKAAKHDCSAKQEKGVKIKGVILSLRLAAVRVINASAPAAGSQQTANLILQRKSHRNTKKKKKKHLLSAAQTVTDTLGLFLEFFEAGSFGKGVLKGAGNKAGGGFNDH